MTRRVLFALAFATRLAGQSAPELRAASKGDSVFLYIGETPSSGGFVVYRRLLSGAFAKRTAAPVEPIRDPAAAAGRLGADLAMVMRATRAVDQVEMLHRLNTDQFAAGVLTLFSRNVAVVLGRLYVDAGATPAADYEYRVVFTDASGRETSRVLTTRVHVADVLPGAPTQVAGRGEDHATRVTWRYPRYQGSSTDLVVGFHVYRGAAAGTPSSLRRLTGTPVLRNDAAPPPFAYRDDEPANGQPYRYVVTAVDALGRESAPSLAVVLTAQDRTPPMPPTDLAVRNGDGIVTVTWRLAPELDAAGYHLERATNLSGPFVRLDRASIPVRRPIWTDTVAAGRQYFYRVIALDAAGNASAPSTAIAALPVDHTPPAAPTGVTATVIAGRRLAVRWTPSSSRDVRGYNVYRGEAGEGDRTVRVNPRPIAVAQLTDSGYGAAGLHPGRSYVVRVSAVDSSFNESSRTEVRVTVPDDEPPGPPSGFTATNVLGRHVALAWTPSTAADVREYALQRTGGGATDTSKLVVRLPATVRVWRDTALVHGRRYVYRLTAVDSAGNASRAVLDSVEFRDFTPPPPPRAAAARALANGRGVEIRWERVVAAELAGYVVYRATLPTGVYRRLNAAPLAGLTYTDSTGRAGRGLFYRVRAVDRSRNESAPSPIAEVARP